MPKARAHHWEFTSRFRRGAFGWKSQPAIQRVKEAVSEIKKVARRDPVLAAEGAVMFLERVSPALEGVDSSSGAIGTAVNHAIEELVAIIAKAPADAKTREGWLERLWEAHANDAIPYIERLGDFWGELCTSPEIASAWADRLVRIVEMAWSPDPELRGFFHGTTACLSALLRAGRYEEILALLGKAPFVFWPYRQWGVRAFAARGRTDEAIRYAEASRGLNDSPVDIARACEEILLASGRVEEAYRRYALEATRGASYLATYQALARKYPQKGPEELLGDLVANTPGDEGKWFAAAKEVGLFDEAIRLANRAPCDPKTLTRAARDFADRRPEFAVEAPGRAPLARRGLRLRDHGRRRVGRVHLHGEGGRERRTDRGGAGADQDARRERDVRRALRHADPGPGDRSVMWRPGESAREPGPSLRSLRRWSWS
jgi:tetratricopeptide (TPR) repeat protein